MAKKMEELHKFGLVGKQISYSFSKNYFGQKFKKLKLDHHEYCNFDIDKIEDFPGIFTDELKGLNVTIPYKEAVIAFLDEIDPEAREIGAVNTIKITNGKLKGFNTDVYGFESSLKPLLTADHKSALVLGTGGASKAVVFTLNKLDIGFSVVSRNPGKQQISYNDLSKEIIDTHKLIINCTPLGTFPNIEKSPKIPYHFLTKEHLLYDLIYNPSKTTFLTLGEKQGTAISNGLKMLSLQAERSWSIWNE